MKGKKSITDNGVRKKKGIKQRNKTVGLDLEKEWGTQKLKEKNAFLKFNNGEIPNRKSQCKSFNGEGIERALNVSIWKIQQKKNLKERKWFDEQSTRLLLKRPSTTNSYLQSEKKLVTNKF